MELQNYRQLLDPSANLSQTAKKELAALMSYNRTVKEALDRLYEHLIDSESVNDALAFI